MKLIKLFKYELIKILIFLLLFISSLVIVLSAQENYYDRNKDTDNNSKNLHSMEKIRTQNKLKN